jgi:hypothetical protein
MKLRNLLIAAAGLIMTAGAAQTASAAPIHAVNHPRRVEVNHRLTHLNRTIRVERRKGEVDAFQARHFRHDVRSIRFQEGHFARHHKGHLTRYEQARLNHEANGVGRHLRG